MAIKKRKLLIFLFFLLLNFLPQMFVVISKPDNLMNWYLTDDAFYYFKTAQNIAEGIGITFDGINPTNGFHPLWMVICVPIFMLARIDLFLPLRVVAAVQILLNAASGLILYEMVSEKISKSFAWITAIFWMFSPFIHGITTKLGLETGLNAFMLISFFYLVSKISWGDEDKSINKQLFWVGLCGVGVLFSRLDNIFVLLMVGIWLVFRGKMISRISQIDFLLILLSAVASFFMRLNSIENIFEYLNFLYLLIGSSLIIKPTLLYFFHAYEIERKNNELFLLKNIFLASTISTVLILAILYFFFDILHVFEGFPRSAVLFDWFISLILIGSHHYFRHKSFLKSGILVEDISIKTNWQTWIGRAFNYFSPIVILLIAYLGFNFQYAGTAMPVSGQIKRWWGTLPNSIYGQPEKTFFGVISGLFDPNRNGGPYWMLTNPIVNTANFLQKTFGFAQGQNLIVIYFFLALASLVFLFILYFLIRKNHTNFQRKIESLALLPLFVGTIFQAMMYKSTGYLHVREWYWIGEMILIVVLFSIIFTVFIEIIEKKLSSNRIISAITFVSCIFLWGNFSVSILQQFPFNGNVPLEYNLEEQAHFISNQTNPGDVIGMTGGGFTAYFFPDRTIINLDGLINSADYFSKLKDGNAADFLIENKVKYIFGSELTLLDSDPYRWVFTESLTFKATGSYFILYTYDPIEK